MSLSVKYLGLDLKNPIIIGSSGLTNSVEKIINLEKSGAGAVVLKSLFEEQIIMEMGRSVNQDYHDYPEALDYARYYTKEKSIIVSTVYKNGNKYIGEIITGLENWMNKNNYSSLADFRGLLSYDKAKDAASFERVQFMKYYSNFN